MAGDRGGLWWQMHRIIAELMPTWVIGENVPGLLSSNGGRDFLTIVASLVQLGYGVTWATLDSQYFGVAQRRRRLFIVGHSGGVPRPEILALSEGLFGHPAPSREAGQDVAGFTPGSFGGYREGLGTLRATDIETGGGNHVIAFSSKDHAADAGELAPTLWAMSHDGSHPNAGGQVAVAFHPIAAGAHAPAIAIQGGENHGGKQQLGPGIDESGTMYTLGCREVHGISTATIPRRLTPTECERLQAWPDDHTRHGITDDGKTVELADGPRYRMCGNGVTSSVVEWIGRRIMSAV